MIHFTLSSEVISETRGAFSSSAGTIGDFYFLLYGFHDFPTFHNKHLKLYKPHPIQILFSIRRKLESVEMPSSELRSAKQSHLVSVTAGRGPELGEVPKVIQLTSLAPSAARAASPHPCLCSHHAPLLKCPRPITPRQLGLIFQGPTQFC